MRTILDAGSTSGLAHVAYGLGLEAVYGWLVVLSRAGRFTTLHTGYSIRMIGSLLRGFAAGLAGTTALNAASYLDMVLRARPASSTPQQTVERLSEETGIEVPGDESQRKTRLTGLGSLTGIATGATVGVAYGAARSLGWRPSLPAATAATALGAIAASSAPMTVLGVTDPRSWSASDWVSDVIPHAAYGLVTSATFSAMSNGRRRRE